MSPLFDFDSTQPGGEIMIHEGDVRVGAGPTVTGRIWLRTHGELDVRWSADANIDLGTTTLTFTKPDIGGVTIPVETTSSSGRGYVPGAQSSECDDLAYVMMHWINLPAILPSEPLATTNGFYAGRWTCVAPPWMLTLDQRFEHPELVATARETGSLVMTHVGKLECADGRAFGSREAVQALSAFQAALSFATGGWVAPALPVGFTATGARVWEHWAPWRCTAYHGHFRWWDNNRSTDLEELCRRFIEEWTDAGRYPAIRHLAYHAISASSDRTTVEARIMLAQAGLEYLGWVNDVLEGDRTPSQQNDRKAHEILRELLRRAQVSTEIPEEFASLASVFDEEGMDGPRAVTWLRNRLVHPKDAAEPYRIESAVSHCWLLSTHYLDLLILHRINYRGRYLPRIPGFFAHSSEAVPWSGSMDS